MKDKLGCIAALAYIGIGFVQLLATVKGIQVWFDWPWMLAAFVSLIVAYIPFVGTVAGIKGATAAWGWALWPAIIFFCWPYVLYLAAVTGGGCADVVSRKKDDIS